MSPVNCRTRVLSWYTPPRVDDNGKVTDFSNMEGQMRQSYANAAELLARFGASLDDVVEEVIYVLDVDAASAVAGPVRKEAYGKDVPQVASTLLGVTRLAFRHSSSRSSSSPVSADPGKQRPLS